MQFFYPRIVLVFLLSASFFASDFIRSVEVKRLMERRLTDNLHIIPIVVVTGIQKSGWIQDTPNILLHRAAFLRDCGEPEKSRNDLEDALDIINQCGMVLDESEARLLETHLLLDAGELELAKKTLDRADAIIIEKNYGLRFAKLYLAKARYFHCTQEPDLAKKWLDESKNRIEKIGQRGLMGEYNKLAKLVY